MGSCLVIFQSVVLDILSVHFRCRILRRHLLMKVCILFFPKVSKYKYLNIITEHLCGNDDNSRRYKIIYAQGNALIRKFYMCTESVKCTLFKSYCSSLYTCQLWYCYRAESTRKLCVAYNNVFRFLCNEPRDYSASYMFVSRGLPTCKMLIRKNVYSF